MSANAIVKHLDIFKDDLPSLLTRGEAVMMQAFCLQRAKEAFHRRIAPRGQAARKASATRVLVMRLFITQPTISQADN